jgi:ABC-type phosphate transport system permease subunit
MTGILVSVGRIYAKSAPNMFTDNFAKEKRRANDKALEEGIRTVTYPTKTVAIGTPHPRSPSGGSGVGILVVSY